IPCELIDRNGDNLKAIVLRLANEWALGSAFIAWLENANYFANTLVDRIVTGYPKDEIEALQKELGYVDQALVTSEIFHLWVIELDQKVQHELPFEKAGLNVIFTDNMEPYRTRKVRILNGAHTMTVPVAYLYGLDTVKECVDDACIASFLKTGLFEEIIPTLDLPHDELSQYANDVIERFTNPFIKHLLMSISLNAISKFKTRVLPSFFEYINRKGCLPKHLSFSLAALIAFYKGTDIQNGELIGSRNGVVYNIKDDAEVLAFFKGVWQACDGTKAGIDTLTKTVLAQKTWWDNHDLNEIEGLTNYVSEALYTIVNEGMQKAILGV
ncbi:MAG: tagaturonate reductase, partial [Hyphomonadaceae bacterium]|nr:tagaturonate reductase [Clostridia bacterium]